MSFRTPDIRRVNLWHHIQKIRRLDPALGKTLGEAGYYVKPGPFFPWASEVWVTRYDAYLPWNFENKPDRHQTHDLFIAACLFKERDFTHGYWWWVAARKPSIYMKQVLNRRIRYQWKILNQDLKMP